MNVEPWVLVLLVFLTLISAFGSLFLKLAAKEFELKLFKLIKNYKLIIGVLLYASTVIIFLPVLKYTNLSIAYPLVSINYIWVSLLSMYFLKEKMSLRKWFSIFLIILGVFLITV